MQYVIEEQGDPMAHYISPTLISEPRPSGSGHYLQHPQPPHLAANNTNSARPAESDPLIRLFGSIHSDLTDVAERHDEYIGEALFRSLRNAE